jgi:hypothetical protein
MAAAHSCGLVPAVFSHFRPRVGPHLHSENTMAKTLGVTKVALNGNDPGTLPGTTVKLGGVTKDPRYASGVLTGFSETPVPFELRCQFIMKSATDVETIRSFEGQCDFITDVGQTYSSSDATITEPPEIGADGITCVIMGTAAVKTRG